MPNGDSDSGLAPWDVEILWPQTNLSSGRS
jgi:hypothetical protein